MGFDPLDREAEDVDGEAIANQTGGCSQEEYDATGT